jgi:hypothetical protein
VIEVVYVGAKHDLKMPTPNDQQPVEAFLSDGSDPSLGHRIGSGRSDRRADDLTLLGLEDPVEGAAELLVPVVDQELERFFAFVHSV